MTLIENNIDQINHICLSRRVKTMWVFGSVLNPGLFRLDSDIDFIIEFNPMALEDYANNYFSLKEDLELTLQHEIDIVSEKYLKNPVFINQLNSTKKLVFSR